MVAAILYIAECVTLGNLMDFYSFDPRLQRRKVTLNILKLLEFGSDR